MYDIVIIGAGPAGISAGIYAKSRGKDVVIIEKNQVGGLIGNVSTVTHYASVDQGETGSSFSEKLKKQAIHAGIQIVYETVNKVNLIGDSKFVCTDQNTYYAKKIIIANGTTPRKLGIPGEQKLCGKGIGLNAARDGERYQGKNVYVIGGADGAIKEALYLSKYAKKVTIVHFENQLGCIAEFKDKLATTSNIVVRLHSRLHAVYGIDQIETLEISDEKTGCIETVEDPGCGIFVYAGAIPNTGLYVQLKLQQGFIPVNENMQTEIDGVYAIGDIRVKQIRQVATAVADGVIAAIHACTNN